MLIQSVSTPLQGGIRFFRYLIPAPHSADVYKRQEEHIIQVDLEDRRNKHLREPDRLLDHIDGHITDNDMYYILLDEIQMCIRDRSFTASRACPSVISLPQFSIAVSRVASCLLYTSLKHTTLLKRSTSI